MATRSLIEGIAENAVAPIGQIGGELLAKAALLLMALIGVGAGAAFLTAALYTVLVEWLGRLEALLAVGGIYLALAAALAVAASMSTRARPSQPASPSAAASPSVAPGPTGAEGSRPSEGIAGTLGTAMYSRGHDHLLLGEERFETGRALGRVAAPVLELMREQGMERERLALEAGVTVAKQLRPWMIVGLILGVGVAMGHAARRQLRL